MPLPKNWKKRDYVPKKIREELENIKINKALPKEVWQSIKKAALPEGQQG